MNKFLAALVAVLLLASCGTKFSLQKRKYNKGFYFASAHSNKTKVNKHIEAAKTNTSKETGDELVETVIVKSATAETELVTLTAQKMLMASVKQSIAQPLSFKNQIQNIKQIALANKIQKTEIKKEIKAERKGLLAKVIRFLLSFIGGWFLGFGVVAYLAASLDPTLMPIAYALFAIGIIFIVLAFVIKVS